MRVPITLDLHLPNFNYPGVGSDQVFDKLVEIATTAEASGFSSVSLMDHLHQIGPVGPPENWMFDGNTMLAGLAARTSKVTLGTLVGGVTYRNPALLAKITTTLDIISGGRAWFGIGAAWFEAEHQAYGFDFPPLGRRFEYLEECLQIVRAMFTQDRATFHGEYFRVEEAYNNPKPIRGDIPILIGGSGEKKTLRMVAQYADGCNLFAADADRARHLLGVLDGHCERLGRDPAEITKTAMGGYMIAETTEAAQAKLKAVAEQGLIPPERAQMTLAGDPDTIGEAASKLKEAGIEGMTTSIADVHDLESVELYGRTLGAVWNG
ncbi:MAG TPA: LLM class F420-dependent oxidoreductase [Solirubrobacteraceae bacterium]|jgi:F420-dependent oxidoreductase-like protein|nr:LLM class F420-dependent oxidoreductase [Solirubrobacteraceae bacterium]